MITIYVHPAVMDRVKSGNISPILILTQYEIDVGDIVEVSDDDEVNTVITKVKSVNRKGTGLYQIELADPATAFIE